MIHPNLIALIGPDGTGKTTQAMLLVDHFKSQKINCMYQWSRFRHFFSFPILLMARIGGYSEVKTIPNHQKIGYHYFYKSRILKNIYPFFLFIDIFCFYILKIYIPIKIQKKMIISDRSIWDTIIDLMISTRQLNFDETLFGKIFLKLLPKNSAVIMLIADENVLKNRRLDIFHDENIKEKVMLYEIISKKYLIERIDADDNKLNINKKILKFIYNE